MELIEMFCCPKSYISLKFRFFCYVVTLKLTDVSEVRTASIIRTTWQLIALMMAAVCTCEMLVNFNVDYTALHPRRLILAAVRT
jgi:hypothetical protein